MYPMQYSVVRKDGLEQIRISGNSIYLTVFHLDKDLFVPNIREKQYYGEHLNTLLAFETTGYRPLMNPFQLQSLHAAVLWYAREKLNNYRMKIRLTDPRRTGTDRLADE